MGILKHFSRRKSIINAEIPFTLFGVLTKTMVSVKIMHAYMLKIFFEEVKK